MDVSYDSSPAGQASNPKALMDLVGSDRLEQVVCTRIDGVDTTLDDLLARPEWEGQQLDLYTFDGWLDEAARRVEGSLNKIRSTASEIAAMSSVQSPIDLLDGLMKKPKAIIAELLEVKEHFNPEVSNLLESVNSIMNGAETNITLAVRSMDFICVADALRYDWSIGLRSLLAFLLGADYQLALPPSEPAIDLDQDQLFEANLVALGERFPDLVSQVRAAWNERDQERYAIDEGPTRLRSPRVNGQRMWSILEPAADLKRVATDHKGDVNLERWDSAATWGVSGELAFKLLGGEMKDRPQIYVRCDLPAFAAELHCSDWRDLLASENTLLCWTVNTYRWTLRNCFVHKDRVRRLSSPNLLQVDPVMYTELHEESGHTELALLLEDRTGESRGRQWAANALSNVPALLSQPDASELAGVAKGLPGLLVAPGPSLRKNFHLISEFAKRGVVVGVSHVLGKLQEVGVDPELTVAIEGNDISNHFEGSDPTKTSLFLCESTHPNVVNQPVAQHWVVHDCEIGSRLRKDPNLKNMNMLASSCSHVAMWTLVKMGCDPIVFVGLDLALEEGRQYTEGCEGTTPTQIHLEVEGYHGGKVQTLAQYNVFRDQFELCLAHPVFEGPRYINATEGGAKIRGIEQLSLAEVIEEISGLPERKREGGILASPESLPSIDWKEVVEMLEQNVSDMKEAEASASSALRAARQAIKCFKAGDESGVSRRGRAAAKRAKVANTILTKDHLLSGRWMAAQNKRSERFERESRYLKDDPHALMRHNLAHYQQLLASLEEATGSLKPLYEKAAQAVRDRYNV